MRKQATYALFAAAAVLVTAAAIYFFNQKPVKTEAYWQAVGQYVYAYTNGDVGSTDPIRVRFVNAAVSAAQVGQPVESGVFSLSPSVPGQAVWEDDRTILLRPTEPLPFGKHYTGKVRLRRIYDDVPDIAKVFDFQFRVRALAYEVVTDGIASDLADPRQQRVTGRIRVNEAVGNADVEKMFSAKQGNRALLVSWTHNADGLTHEWTVEGVERSNARSRVNLSWSGSPIGVNDSGEAVQVVAPFDEFGVLSARAIQVEEQYVVVNFSDPVSTGQDLTGLIRIEGYDGKLRFVVDGNYVRVYPSTRITGDHRLQVDAGVRSMAGQAMKEAFSTMLTFEDLKPAVRLVGRGAVIPQNADGGVIFPFEAVGLNAVDVEIFKVFNSNILQYLQVNEIEGEAELERVGRIVLQRKINLAELNENASSKNWQRYALDLKDMIRKDPGAIYQVRLAFRRSYTNTGCSSKGDDQALAYFAEAAEEGNFASIMGSYRGIYWQEGQNWYGGYDYEYYGEDDGEEGEEGEAEPANNYDDGRYRWERRSDPCAKEYYNNEHFAQRNVFVSDLGLTAKRGKDNSLFLAVTDLHTTQPVGGLELEIFDYQLQSIGKARTASDGTVMMETLRGNPFVAVATGRDRRGYLRMADGGTLSLSRFDVTGVEPQKGLKGYIYGERGVWRPGDSIFLNFVLEDKTGKLPPNHPITFDLTDPRGAMQYRTVQTTSVGGVYPLHCVTRLDAPTGNWTARVQVGGATFTQQVKVETVKPNRLKINLDFDKKALTAADFEYPGKVGGASGKLAVTWLHGAVAKGLKAKVEMLVRPTQTTFSGYKGFVFDDPARSFYSEPQTLLEANVDDNGTATVPLKFSERQNVPGKLIANFKVRAFEKGGDFSTDNFAMDVFPYDNFVGVLIPTDRWGGKAIDPLGGNVTFAMVDKAGKPLANRKITVALYRCDWRWWWDEDRYSNVAQFNSANSTAALERAELTTNANGQVTWKVKPNGWGRYLVRAEDEAGGHAAGDFFWRGYPEQLDDIKSRNAAAMLPFSVEKEKYLVGEDVTLKVPASENGRILLTLETGTRVAKHLWFDAKAGDNFLTFKAEPAMAPTVYAHVSLLQPHAQTVNDLPIRMYGVVPVNVENPGSRLEAQLDMPDVLKPDEPFTIAFREKGGKACTYTLAIVDEGLLDLTRFKTPNPWDAFFAREGLGVKTWDIYDYVLGAYGASLERILAIGGDGINQKAKNANQVNRFKPTVIHVGPFRLEKGQQARHTLKIENYVGSVRVMAVLSAPAPDGKGMYGSSEKTCSVRKALMVLPTLPRTLGPGESLRLPVNVFAMEQQVKSATVRVQEKSGLVTVQGSSVNTLNFAQPGEEMTYFDLKVGQKTGIAKFVVTAQGAGESATQEIELLVRNPNPVVSTVWSGTVEPGKDWTTSFDPAKYTDITNAVIEVSALPSMNLSRHLEYLIQYPHGCIEQTTSAAFPQLYVDILTPLMQKQRDAINRNVTAAINKMQKFQTGYGAFSYWPGEQYVNEWGSNYAGHFLLEAKNKGYTVSETLLSRWLEFQTNASRRWQRRSWDRFDDDLTQAYRLYTLSLAGKPDLAGMNRLREAKDMYAQSAYLLAAAYAQAGKPEAAREITYASWKTDWQYNWCGYTYGSDLRDKALILETYTALGDAPRSQALVEYLCKEMGNENGWYWNTQSLSTSLRALARYAQKNMGSAQNATYAYRLGSDGGFQAGDGSKLVSTVNFTETAERNNAVAVRNSGNTRLYARLVVSGQSVVGDQAATSNNMQIAVRYTDLKGQQIDPLRIKQGTDFVAEVTITRKSPLNFQFNDLALEQVFPSGWEIMNTRMVGFASGNAGTTSNTRFDYQDVRDDRVFTYFNLKETTDFSVFRIQLNAAYTGRYYLPTVGVSSMYDNRIGASTPGKWVEVI